VLAKNRKIKTDDRRQPQSCQGEFLGERTDFVAAEEAVRTRRPSCHQVLALAKDDKRDDAAALIETTGTAQVALVDERLENVAKFSRRKLTSRE
jgi:hypothetical protein